MLSKTRGPTFVSMFWLPAMLLTLGCGDCEFEARRVDAFLNRETSQTCARDSDCVVENLNCVELEAAFCGQVSLNKKTATSKDWQDLKSDAADCAEDSCTTCNAQRLAECIDQRCSKLR